VRYACLAAALALAGCGAAQKVAKAVEGPPKRTRFEQEQIDETIRNGGVVRGMTRSEVRASRGEPQKTDVVEALGGKLRRWVYPFDEIYFDADGLVVGVKAAY
jgi:hypothetical protein